MMKVRYKLTDYVDSMPKKIQTGIKGAVERSLRTKYGLKGAELKFAVEDAMTGRLSSLNDVINVRYWLDKANGKL